MTITEKLEGFRQWLEDKIQSNSHARHAYESGRLLMGDSPFNNPAYTKGRKAGKRVKRLLKKDRKQ